MKTNKNNIKTLVAMFIVTAISVNLYADNVSTRKKNGFLAEKSRKLYVPFSQELLGCENFWVTISTRYINYIDGISSGIVICINDNTNEIVSIANMNNDGKVDGELQIFPNGIFSVKCMVKNGILNGKCIMKFQPYRHRYNPQERILDPSYDPLYKNKVSQETSPDFKLETVGTYKNGERFDGEFLKVNTFGLYREVIITTYKDGKIMKNSKPQYFKTQGRNVVE